MKSVPVRKNSSWQALTKKLFQGPIDSDLYKGEKVLAQLKAIRKEVYWRDSSIRFGKAIPVFHPESLMRLCWDLTLIFFVLYQAFFVPLSLCFPLPNSQAIQDLEIISILIFLVDIPINCNTAYYSKGSLVTSRKEVLKHYIRGWFISDAFSSFPLTWLLDDMTPGPSNPSDSRGYLLLFRLFRFLRILRLLRLVKLKALVVKLEEFIASDWIADCFQLIRLIAFICLMAHWIACWWFYVGALEAEQRESSWTRGLQGTAEEYVTALYYAFTTMTTVGYGDITPVTTTERIFATCTMLLCCILQAYVIGNIGSLVAKHNSASEQYRNSVLSLNQYMRRNALPAELQFRVRRFLEFLWEQRKYETFNEKEVLEQLSDPLRDEVYGQVTGTIVCLCPVIKDFDPSFVLHIGKLLKSESFAPDDVIFEAGHLGGKMYYITRGAVDVFHSQTADSFRILRDKSCFGEISFFLGVPRCASIRCVEFSDLLSLDRYEIEPLLSQYPESREHFRVLALRVQSSGDLSALQIRCFICNCLGHVAVNCRRGVVNFNHEETRDRWLRSRFSHTKYISRFVPPIPNHIRKHKRAAQRLTAKNVIGRRRDPKSLYPDDPNLLPRITEYEETFEREKTKRTTTGDMRTDSHTEKQLIRKKTDYAFIYKDSFDDVEDSTFLDESGESGKPQVERQFRRSLLQSRLPDTSFTPTLSPKDSPIPPKRLPTSKLKPSRIYPLVEKSTGEGLDQEMDMKDIDYYDGRRENSAFGDDDELGNI